MSMVPFRLSASYNELYELGYRPSHNLTSTTTTLFDSPASAFSTHTSVAALYTQLAFAERQIFILDAENTLLREKNENLMLNIRVLLAEIEIMQVVFGKNTHLARNVVSLPQGKLTDYEKQMIEATPIENATHESDSSRVLQTLISHHDPESFVASADMGHKLCQIPPEKEKADRFADSKATSKLKGATALLARLPLVASGCRAINNNSSHSGDPLKSEEFQINNASTCSRSRPSSVRTVSISHTKGDQWTPRPEGQENCSLRTSQCPFETNCSRRFTFPNSFDIVVRTVEKRHGFLMPCIKPVQNHASIPVSSLSNASCSHVPSTIGSLSLNHRNVPLSAERLCATFSSGSLGSLELTVSSGSNHSFVANFLSNDPRIPEKSSNVKHKNISSWETVAGNDKKRGSYAQFKKEIIDPFIQKELESTIVAQSSTGKMVDTNSYISFQEQQNDVNYPLPQVVSVTGASELALRLPSIESLRPSTKISQRFAWPGHDPATIDSLTPKDDHSQVLARQDQPMKEGSAVQLRKMQTTSRKENKLKEVSWNTKVVDCSKQYPRPCTPTAKYTLRPKLSIMKCEFAKPVESVRPVNHTNIPVPVSRSRIAHQAGFTSSPVSSLQVGPYKSIETLACQKNTPISKPCTRLRVVNDCNPRRPSLTRSGTQLRINLKDSTTNKDKAQYQRARIDYYGRIRSHMTRVELPQTRACSS